MLNLQMLIESMFLDTQALRPKQRLPHENDSKDSRQASDFRQTLQSVFVKRDQADAPEVAQAPVSLPPLAISQRLSNFVDFPQAQQNVALSALGQSAFQTTQAQEFLASGFENGQFTLVRVRTEMVWVTETSFQIQAPVSSLPSSDSEASIHKGVTQAADAVAQNLAAGEAVQEQAYFPAFFPAMSSWQASQNIFSNPGPFASEETDGMPFVELNPNELDYQVNNSFSFATLAVKRVLNHFPEQPRVLILPPQAAAQALSLNFAVLEDVAAFLRQLHLLSQNNQTATGDAQTETPAIFAAPAEPEAPAAPAAPVDAEAPAAPAVPAAPVDAEAPATPAVPAAPVDSEAPATPAVPAVPVDSEAPATPAAPAVPVDSEAPATPAVPAAPVDSEAPATPAVPAAPVDSEAPATPAAPAAPVDSEAPATPAAPAAPVDAEAPATPAAPAAPVDSEAPATPAVPAAPVDSEAPATPAVPAAPVDSEAPATPAAPAAPVDSEAPATPASPAAPVDSEAPATPASPAAPVDAEAPATPAVPAAPATPASPAAPVDSEAPATPAVPAAPVDSEAPATPAVPAAPVDSEAPATPAVPAAPATPAAPAVPVDAEAPATPAAPAAPVDSEVPATPAVPAAPATPAAPAAPAAPAESEAPAATAPPASPVESEAPAAPATPVAPAASEVPATPAAPAEFQQAPLTLALNTEIVWLVAKEPPPQIPLPELAHIIEQVPAPTPEQISQDGVASQVLVQDVFRALKPFYLPVFSFSKGIEQRGELPPLEIVSLTPADTEGAAEDATENDAALFKQFVGWSDMRPERRLLWRLLQAFTRASQTPRVAPRSEQNAAASAAPAPVEPAPLSLLTVPPLQIELQSAAPTEASARFVLPLRALQMPLGVVQWQPEQQDAGSTSELPAAPVAPAAPVVRPEFVQPDVLENTSEDFAEQTVDDASVTSLSQADVEGEADDAPEFVPFAPVMITVSTPVFSFAHVAVVDPMQRRAMRARFGFSDSQTNAGSQNNSQNGQLGFKASQAQNATKVADASWMSALMDSVKPFAAALSRVDVAYNPPVSAPAADAGRPTAQAAQERSAETITPQQAANVSASQVIQAINNNVPIQLTDFPAYINQVVQRLGMQANAVQSVQVTLAPRQMGNVVVEFQTNAQKQMTITLYAQTMNSAQALEAYKNDIQQIVGKTSFALGNITVKQAIPPARSSQGTSNQNQQNGDFSSRQRRGGNRRRNRADDDMTIDVSV